jgi:hypothetical protein
MDNHQNYFKPLICYVAIIVISFGLSENSLAQNVNVYMVEKNKSETSLGIEIFVNVATEFLGSYDLGISFNENHLQFQSLEAGTACCQLLPEPTNSIKNGILKVNGIFKYLPKGQVSLLFINFDITSTCDNLPFDIYVYDLMDKDRELTVNIIGYEITQISIARMKQKQQDQLPLVDDETIERIKPLVDIRFNQNDQFINQLIETIGKAKTNQYQADILRLSRIANHMNIEMNCSRVIDIIKCLQCLSGRNNVTCNNIVGETPFGLDDVLAHFQKMAFLPIYK